MQKIVAYLVFGIVPSWSHRAGTEFQAAYLQDCSNVLVVHRYSLKGIGITIVIVELLGETSAFLSHVYTSFFKRLPKIYSHVNKQWYIPGGTCPRIC